jgi:hypothetical protein
VPDFVLHRDYALRSMSGHMINFKKGDPTWVPPGCVKEAVAIGATPVDGPVDVLDPEVQASIVPEGAERNDLIFAAFEDMEAKNEREEWTASGMPTSKALEKILGFEVDSKERNTLWVEYRALKSEG